MDASSSIISSFKFISYKIDEFTFEMSKHVSLLAVNKSITEKSEINIGIKQPILFKKDNRFISGIDCKITLMSNGVPVVNLKASISGLFTTEDSIDPTLVDNIVKMQFPTILFPYLRSTITTFFANAGFGTFIFPLINVVELAKNNLENIPIQIIE